MSFDLYVFVPQLPTDLARRWEQILPEFGLRCTFYPGYHPSPWHDAFAPVWVEVLAQALPYATVYGPHPLLTDIELDDMDVTEGEYVDNKISALEDAPIHLPPPLSIYAPPLSAQHGAFTSAHRRDGRLFSFVCSVLPRRH